MSRTLENIKVLELGAWVAAPSAGVVLADWGAEVLKIEDPVTGDAMRGWRSIRGVEIEDVHFWFELYNRNKRSIGLDLRKEEGRRIFYSMVKKADVFLSNFRGSVLERLKIDYGSLSEMNPKLIYAAVSGYGHKGRDVEKPGYDITAFWSRSGILCKLIPGEGKSPVDPPFGMGDTIVGTITAGAISAALFNRERTGVGEEIDISLYQTAVWSTAMDIEAVLYTGSPIPKINRTMMPNPLENDYCTKEGKWLRVAMIQSDRFWPDFCEALEIGHLMKDKRFKDAADREANNSELISLLDRVFATKTCSEWERIFQEHELISATVQDYSEVVNDPQAIENGFFAEIDHPSTKKVRVVATPVNFGKTSSTARVPAPELGQHTEEILLDLDYSWEEITGFKERGIIN